MQACQFQYGFLFVYVCVRTHMCTCRTQLLLFEIALYSSSTLFSWDTVFQTNPEFIDAVCPPKQLAPGPSLSLLLNQELQEGWWAHLALTLMLLTQTWAFCFPTTLQPWNSSDIESQRFIYFYSVSGYYAWMNVWAAHVSWVHTELRCSQILWICGWLWALIWVTGTEPRSCVRTAGEIRLWWVQYILLDEAFCWLRKKLFYIHSTLK